MTEETEARIPPADLGRLALVCKACGAETTVDLRDNRQARAWEEGRAFKCGVCSVDFDGLAKSSLRMLREGLLLLDRAGGVATFRIARSREP
jgi:hypothetical protein